MAKNRSYPALPRPTILPFLLVLSVPILFAQSVRCDPLPPGSLTFTYQYRLLDVDPETGEPISLHASNYSLGFAQESVNWGRCSGFFNWVDEPSYHRLGSWLVELNDLYLNGAKVDVGVGDNLLRFPLVGDLPYRFLNMVDPDVPLEGARFRLSSDRGDLELFAGSLVLLKGFYGTEVDYTGETMVGAKAHYSLLPEVRLGCKIVRTEGDDDEDVPVNFRRNDIYGLSVEVEPWSGYQVLQGELSLSRYQKRREDTEPEEGWDYALVAGPSIRRPRFSFDANYRRVGTNYHPYRQYLLSDQEGFFASAEYTPWSLLSVFASGDRHWNNLDGDSDVSTIDWTSGNVGFSIGGPPYPLATVRYGIIAMESRSSTPSETDNRLQSLSAEASYRFSNWFPILRYQHFDYDDRATPSSEYQSDDLFLELRRIFANTSYAWINGQWNRTERRDPQPVTDLYTLRLGLDYRPFPAFWVRGEASYARLREDRHQNDTESKGILVACTARITRNLDLYAEYQYVRVDGSLGNADRDENRLYLRASQRFNWGAPVSKKAAPKEARERGYGAIVGSAFSDRNGNGVLDEGEPGLAGMQLQLEDGTIATSDASGGFSFTNVEMGEHLLTLDVRRVPIEYDLVTDSKTKVEVKRRGTARVDFPLQLLGKMQGRVIEDANGNGKIDAGELGMPEVMIIATTEGKELLGFTDEKGEFFFENLRGGAYQLSLDLSSLPEETEVTPAEPITVQLPVGAERSDLDFLVRIQPRPAIKKIFETPDPPESIQPKEATD